MRVLIAEDHPVTRRLLVAQLTKWGYEVVVCSDGRQAWDALSVDDAPALVVLDWMMPEVTGLSLCRQIRQLGRDPYTYIILLTAKNEREDILAGLEAGADDYVIKPFDPHELKVRVRAGARIVQLQQSLLAALEASKFQATHDALTGLWNRAAIMDILARELARSSRDNTPVGVILGDVDHFKRINDQHGHLAGDAVLRSVAERLRHTVRSYDSVGRYGGEEFLVVLPGCDLERVAKMAERLGRDFGNNPLMTPEGTFNITLSLGVACINRHCSAEMAAVIRSVDEAMYRAKRNGRNRVELAEVTSPWEQSEQSRQVTLSAISEQDSQMLV